MPVAEILSKVAVEAGAATLTALTTCLGEGDGLQCCTSESDQWTIGGYFKHRLIVGIVCYAALGVTYLLTSIAKNRSQVPDKQLEAVEDLKDELKNVKGVEVEVLGKAD